MIFGYFIWRGEIEDGSRKLYVESTSRRRILFRLINDVVGWKDVGIESRFVFNIV